MIMRQGVKLLCATLQEPKKPILHHAVLFPWTLNFRASKDPQQAIP
jgi:hypothetical protein